VGMVAGVFPVVTSSSFMAHNLLVKITVIYLTSTESITRLIMYRQGVI